jgi:hypothetical protein
MIYVLVVITMSGNYTQSIAMQEFNTLEQCQYVASSLKHVGTFNRTNWAACFEKGAKK